MSTINDFRIWLAQAIPGERFVYYEGDLYHDRQHDSNVLPTVERYALTTLADEIYRAARTDQILLCQKRLGDSRWAYIAIRRRQPRRRPKSISRLLNLVGVS